MDGESYDEEQARKLYRRRRKRCFHRVLSGLEKGGDLRFLTLTSSDESPYGIEKSWLKLYKRMKRRGLIQGYVKVREYTDRGYEHLHVLYRGSYISQRLLSEWWLEIHKASVVDIRSTYGTKRKIAGYLVKYMLKRMASYSWSQDWVYRGFVKTWYQAKAIVGFARMERESVRRFLIHAWGGHCRRCDDPKLFLAILDSFVLG